MTTIGIAKDKRRDLSEELSHFILKGGDIPDFHIFLSSAMARVSMPFGLNIDLRRV
jgi:hypothetical protein